MNNKNLTIVLVVVALAIGAYFVMQSNSGDADLGLGPTAIIVEDGCLCAHYDAAWAIKAEECADKRGDLDQSPLILAGSCKKSQSGDSCIGGCTYWYICGGPNTEESLMPVKGKCEIDPERNKLSF